MYTVIIPAYNESDRIIPTLKTIEKFKQTLSSELEVIIVCDGCSDDTEAVVTNFIKDYSGFRLISYLTNRGKGYAVRQGILASKGDIVGFMDADGSTAIEELNVFLEKFNADEELSCVIASRRTKDAVLSPAQPWYRQIMGEVLSLITRIVLRVPFTDTQCGFKFVRGDLARECFAKMTIDGFSFDIEFIYYLHFHNYKILEQGVHWHNDDRSKVSPIKDGLKMLKTVYNIKTNHHKKFR